MKSSKPKVNIFYRIWRFFLPFIFVFVLVHFFKDITQDILQIETSLDVFGNACEDISGFSNLLKMVWIWGGVNSFFIELFLLISLPHIIRKKSFSKLELYSLIATIFLLLFLVISMLLDARYKIL
jgi:hypothetical protein